MIALLAVAALAVVLAPVTLPWLIALVGQLAIAGL